MEDIWLHFTKRKEHYLSILENGFKMPSNEGRFGKGIYFCKDKSFGYFGDYKIRVNITEPILELTHRQICKEIFPEFNLLEDEEGISMLKEYALKKGFKAVSIEYADGEKELVAYDLKIIKIIK